MTAFVVYDVFTDSAFGGNPLAVVPDAHGLPQHLLQRIAREFGFSETTFVYPGNDAGHPTVRIFTPTQEIPFAGHPLVGTAVALNDAGAPSDLRLGLKSGEIACRVNHGRASFYRRTRLDILHRPDIEDVARCLSLPVRKIGACVTASAGLPFTLVPLTDRRALSACVPDMAAFRDAHALYPTPFDFAIYAYLRESNIIHARMFAPLDDIPEDPATGSAAAALALHLARGRELALSIHQGDDMGRPSRIQAEADPDGVTIAGHAVRTMEGRLVL